MHWVHCFRNVIAVYSSWLCAWLNWICSAYFSMHIVLQNNQELIHWTPCILMNMKRWQSQSQNIFVINAKMALNHVTKTVNSYWGSSEQKMVFQKASSRLSSLTTEGKLVTKGGHLFNGSTDRTEEAAFQQAICKERWRNFRSWPRRWEQAGRVENTTCER